MVPPLLWRSTPPVAGVDFVNFEDPDYVNIASIKKALISTEQRTGFRFRSRVIRHKRRAAPHS